MRNRGRHQPVVQYAELQYVLPIFLQRRGYLRLEIFLMKLRERDVHLVILHPLTSDFLRQHPLVFEPGRNKLHVVMPSPLLPANKSV